MSVVRARSFCHRHGQALAALLQHVAQHPLRYTLLVVLYAWALQHLCVNWTPSLPYTLLYVDEASQLKRGDLVVFRFEGAPLGHLLPGQRLLKRIVGVSGDEISVCDRTVFVNGVSVGTARTRTVDGQALDVIEPGVIPPNRFYVAGTHVMSFDSRYRRAGLVRREQIVGRATALL